MAAEQVHATRQERSILAVRRKQRFEAVTNLRNEGMGIRAIVRQLGLEGNRLPFLLREQRGRVVGGTAGLSPTLLDEFAEYLHERFG